MSRSAPPGAFAPSGHDVDHVWGNLRVLLPGGIARACQLGGDRLAPHLAELAESVTVFREPIEGRDPDGSYDLVVVDDLARVGSKFPDAMTDARRLCRPDGVVLVGSSSRLESAQIGRWVRSGGWSWLVVLPGPKRPAVVLDPKDPLAAEHFRRHLAFAYRPPGRRGPVARMLQVRNRLALLAPGSLALRATSGRVALLAGDDARPALLDELTAFVRSSWRALELPGRAPDRLSSIAIAHRRTRLAVVSVVLLGGEIPVVAKLPRYGRSSAAVWRESRNLDAVGGTSLGTIHETVPRSLGLHEIGGVEVHLQTGVSGRLLAAESARRLRPSALRRQLQLMFTWTARLQRASGRWTFVDDALIDERLGPLARAAVDALGGDRHVRTLLERAIEQARALSGTPIRLGVAHGDLWAGNVLVEDGWISGVVDWERAGVDELPIWDPVKAVLDAAYHLDRYRSIPRRGRAALPRWGDLGTWEGIADPRRAIGFRAAVADRSWLSELARDSLISAFVDAEIPVGWLPVAIPFHLVREFVHPDASERSVQGWGSVLRALAEHPGTWADDLVGDRRGARTTVPEAETNAPPRSWSPR
jgi:hypothetical protein